jgi:hypothetical protein
MRVLGEPQGLQATLLDHPTESTWCRGVDGGEHRDTDLHAVNPSFVPSSIEQGQTELSAP